MPDTFNCPNCGAPLDYKGSDPIIRCPYCNGSVIVPDNLRGKPAFSAQPHNFTLSGVGDMGGLINQARRLKEARELALAGNMDEAERIYREITGASPEEAHISVDALAHGQPIILSGQNAQQVISSVRMTTSTTPLSIQPVDEKSSRKIARTLGCGIGCFVVALVSFILLTTLVPALGGLAGVLVALKPDLVITALPLIPGVTEESAAPSATPGFARQELSFGGEGTGPGLFNDPRAIAVNPASGAIFVGDYQDGRVQSFDEQGKFITQWILGGKKPIIQGMAASRGGNIYIAASGKILVYNSSGKLLSTFAPPAGTDYYEDVALLADGSLMVISRGESIVHLSDTGQVLDRIDAAISTVSGDSELDSKIALDGLGNIYLLGTFNNAVFIFDARGKFKNRFGGAGSEPGQLRAPEAIAVDGKGRIYISDIKGVQIFSNDGRYINVIKVKNPAFGLAFDDQGKLFLTSNQPQVERYDIPK